MHLEDCRRVDRQGTVYIDGDRWDSRFSKQRVQVIDNFLGTSYGKRWYENTPTFRSGIPDNLSQTRFRSIDGFVITVSVGGFHDELMSPCRRYRITNDR